MGNFKIMKNGSAALDGRLRVGDMLVKIENDSLINERHKKAVKMLQKAPKRVKLIVRRNNTYVRVSQEIKDLTNFSNSFQLLAEAGIIRPDVNSLVNSRLPRIEKFCQLIC